MQSKENLDKVIQKSRVHFYKPIQIAEILFHFRRGEKIDPSDLESYRNISKKWRDEVSRVLVGRVSTSSQKYQDNVFEKNAMPPKLLSELAAFNNKNSGIVENYIYNNLRKRLSMVSEAADYLNKSTIDDFDIAFMLSKFTKQAGLKRSIDKMYEITVYALFSTIIRALKVEVSMEIKNTDQSILEDFSDFIRLVLALKENKKKISIPGQFFRAGVTNAADTGLDMWANFGPAIQVKHVSLSEDLAEDVAENTYSGKVILVCLDGEKEIIEKIADQLGTIIQSTITVSDLKEWYSTCFSDKYKKILGRNLLEDLRREFSAEFPLSNQIDPFLKERGYDPRKLIGIWSL